MNCIYLISANTVNPTEQTAYIRNTILNLYSHLHFPKYSIPILFVQ